MMSLGRSAQRVYASLRKDILGGMLPEGARVPTERELCTRFSMSRETVRKALRQLCDDGFIENLPHTGSTVRRRASDAVGSSIISVMFCGTGTRLTTMQDRIQACGCTMALFSQMRGQWDVGKEAEFLHQVKRQRHRALFAFCSPHRPGNEKLLQEIADNGTRVVHIEPHQTGLPGQEFCMPDYARAGLMAAAHLIANGQRSVQYVGIAQDGPSFALIRAGVQEAVSSLLRTEADASNVFIDTPFHQTEQNLFQMVQLLPRKHGGLVCGSIERARAIEKAYKLVRSRVPKGIQIIAVEQMLDAWTPDFQWEALFFNRIEAFDRMLETVLADGSEPIRELLPPRFG